MPRKNCHCADLWVSLFLVFAVASCRPEGSRAVQNAGGTMSGGNIATGGNAATGVSPDGPISHGIL